MQVPVQDSRVDVPGGSVFVRQWQPQPTGPLPLAPLVLLHDSLGAVAMWRDFPERLAAHTGRTVLAYDRLGFGQSTPRSEAPTAGFIDEEARVLFPALARGLGLERYVLLGHSVGGGMALRIAADQGAHCAAVITESAQAFVEAQTLAGIRAAKQDFADAAHFARLAKWHGERARWVLDAWTEVWLSDAFRPWSLDACLGQIHCPVLALHGDSDEFGSSAFPRRITEGVAGAAHMEILPGCGHVPHREHESVVLQHIGAFLHDFAVP